MRLSRPSTTIPTPGVNESGTRALPETEGRRRTSVTFRRGYDPPARSPLCSCSRLDRMGG